VEVVLESVLELSLDVELESEPSVFDEDFPRVRCGASLLVPFASEDDAGGWP
jgi:hypothetical protein